MLKRILGIFLCFTMLFLATFPVTAVNSEETTGGDTEATPTIESILNDYHAKSAALSAASTADASTYSRTVSEDPQDQLKQETIAELYAAGYAAYDLNSSTYQSLERQLSTDFSAMGLDPDGSYIVVISGEEDTQNQTSPGNNSRVITLPPHVWEGDDVPYFSYTYNGTVYNMRYLTVTGSYDNGLAARVEIDLINDFTGTKFEKLMHSVVAVATSAVEDFLYLDTISALISYPIPEPEDSDSMDFEAGSVWSVKYMQVCNVGDDEWVSSASVEYVSMYYSVTYTYLTTVNGVSAYDSIFDESDHEIQYTEHYDDGEWLKLKAAEQFCYNPNGLFDETIWEVEYLFLDPVNTDQVIHSLTVGRP